MHIRFREKVEALNGGAVPWILKSFWYQDIEPDQGYCYSCSPDVSFFNVFLFFFQMRFYCILLSLMEKASNSCSRAILHHDYPFSVGISSWNACGTMNGAVDTFLSLQMCSIRACCQSSGLQRDAHGSDSMPTVPWKLRRKN